MTARGLAERLERFRVNYPGQVIVGFLHPDGLEVVIPMSPELLRQDEELAGRALMDLHNTAAEEARKR